MWYKPKQVKKLALNSQLPTVQVLTNDVQGLILCLSYFVATVLFGHSANPDQFISSRITAAIHKTPSPISSGSPSLPDSYGIIFFQDKTR